MCLFEWLDHFLALLAKSIIELKKELLSAHNAKGVTDQEKHGAREVEISNIKADIDRVRKLNIGISTQVWQTGLEERYNRLRQAVAVAGVWPWIRVRTIQYESAEYTRMNFTIYWYSSC